MTIHIDKNRCVWISYEYLRNYGVSEKTVENWKFRKIGKRTYINNRAFIKYDTIPETTRKILPPEKALRYDSRMEWRSKRQNEFFLELEKAYKGISVAKWRNLIRENDLSLTEEDITEYARRASVFEKIQEVYTGVCGDLEALHAAFLQIFPNWYTKKNRFLMAVKKTREQGILSVAIDHRCKNGLTETYDAVVKYWAMYILNHNRGFSQIMCYETFCDVCKKEGYKVPSLQWFHNFYHANRNTIDSNRLGKTTFEENNRNYAKIIPALYVGDQWQMDGWRIPIYCKKRNESGRMEYYVTYTLFAVMDAHSRRIIGFDIAESENTESILKGLERAVKTTLILPYEIVADNHSFNKTKEAGNLKDEFAEMGVTWTIDSNPRRKAILERAFRTIGDRHFKNQYGYIGQGIKSKIENGRTQQELIDKWTEPDKMLNYEQVVCIAVSMVDKYNNSVMTKIGDTPNQLYNSSKQPHSIKIDEFKSLALFIRQSEYTVKHGQIIIRRGGHEYEYQLPAKYSQRWNNQKVSVRYSDFDTIYLYEPESDKPICSVVQKMSIHGALANQTETDIEYFHKNKGRIKGIENQAKKKKEKFYLDAENINPEAYDAINRLMCPKDIIEKVRQNKNLREMAYEMGVFVDNVVSLPDVNDMLDSTMKPKKKDTKHPFAGRGNMEILNINI